MQGSAGERSCALPPNGAFHADAACDGLAEEVIGEYRPGLLALNAGVVPHLAPVQEQTWETFSRNWHVDTQHVFAWVRSALRAPLEPGGVVVAMSSGAVLAGSPLKQRTVLGGMT